MSSPLGQDIHTVNSGLEHFTKALADSGSPFVDLDWRPPASGDARLIELLLRVRSAPKNDQGLTAREAANREAARRVMAGQPVLTGLRPAHEAFPGMTRETLFHAGPPIDWAGMCGPMRAACIGALKYEGLASPDAEAQALMDSGKIDYSPNHSHGAVGPMTGIISYSMPVFEVLNQTFGNTAYCTINEGIGKVMRFGANGLEVIERLLWLEQVLGPALDQAIRSSGGVNVKNVMAQALAMGDEMHQRNVAASLVFHSQIAGSLAAVLDGSPHGPAIAAFLAGGNQQFFLNLAMAGCKALMDPARDVKHSSMVTAMSRNGVRFGINVSSLGSRWFQAPCNMPVGLYFPGYSEKDANPDMGDSAIVECAGLGGFAMACSPAVVSFVGSESVADALRHSREMQTITVAPNPDLPMPPLDFLGVATGIDIVEVVESGVLPVINTGIAHREPGVGQVGAGIVTPPMAIMVEALEAYVEKEGL